MKDWKDGNLGKFLTIEHGFAFKGEYFTDVGQYIVLTPGNFYEAGGFKLRPGKDRYYAGEIPERYILKQGDLIVAMTEQAEGLLGCPAFIPESNRYLHNQRLGLVYPKTNLADKTFLYFLFNTNLVRQQIRNSSSGAKVRHTSPERMYRVKVRMPPLGAQKRIAAILSAYDELVENNKRRIAALEKMAEEIYREWFVRFRFPGYEEVRFDKGVPEGWDLVNLEKAFVFTGGGTPSKEISWYWDDGNINWFTPSDITSSKGIFLQHSGSQCTEEGLSNSSARLFPPYSIMMTSRATIGAIGINTTPACTNQGFITCIPNERYPLTFLYHWVKLARPHFEVLSSGATFAELTKGTFKRITLLTPSENVILEFDRIVLPFFKEIEILLRQNESLNNSRDLLLPKLISGRLSVENLDIQFPPSMKDEVEVDRQESGHA